MTENDTLIQSAEAVSLFCRLNINAKKNLPIRSSEIGLLILIVKSESPVTPLIAADFFKVKKPMIAATVSSLIKQGYIIKIPSKEDKRSFTLLPTEKAITLTEHTCLEYYKTLDLLKARMGDIDFENLITLLEKANEILLEERSHE